ncbi:hypothetical protein [Burkholderia plantarii]|uniref:hypothetical protein n=1 Tax=Burkholderia plantarii TaxID=41899 RepID=UPI0018DEAC56|nr:hypothetical protein [Burkholderia plantarii]MBI0328331.1 hypothetical protein [Burkholderia plantarii]
MEPYDSAEPADFAMRPGDGGNEVEIDDMGTVRRTGRGGVDDIMVAQWPEPDHEPVEPARGPLDEVRAIEPRGDAELPA